LCNRYGPPTIRLFWKTSNLYYLSTLSFAKSTKLEWQICEWMGWMKWSTGENILPKEHRSTWRESSLTATLSTTNPTQAGLGLITWLRSELPATKGLIHGRGSLNCCNPISRLLRLIMSYNGYYRQMLSPNRVINTSNYGKYQIVIDPYQ